MEKKTETAVDPPCSMIVVAAGQGKRFGSTLPKQYRPVSGVPLLVHTLTHLQAHPLINRIVPIIAADGFSLWDAFMSPHLGRLPKVTAPVTGGAERQHSVQRGIEALNLAAEAWIGIHDGARPLVSRTLLDRLFQARDSADALIAALPAQDTIKQVGTDHRITGTLQREEIWLAQTPQIFRYGLIRSALEAAAADGFIGTDDASLVERLGLPVLVVPGDAHNIKVTHPRDEALASLLLAEEDACQGA
ncbi:MAG: 2-C-methyl-D-erythritol 4-phosphate cytidylyltransferase [Magnetococcales bacterium]|nr:2-C-methyl-D-erythritol 4-phosphate cytidylyltransferase [Magnetococcales bacterium]